MDGLATYYHTAFPMSPTSRSLISLVGNLMFSNICISAAVEEDHNWSESGRTITSSGLGFLWRAFYIAHTNKLKLEALRPRSD